VSFELRVDLLAAHSSRLAALLNKVLNVQVSDTCLPAGRQQTMSKESKAGLIKIKSIATENFFIQQIIYTRKWENLALLAFGVHNSRRIE
jgi:hypothetical protein